MSLTPPVCTRTSGIPVRFEFLSLDGAKIAVPVGTTWSVQPPGSGVVTPNGEFTPLDVSQKSVVTITAATTTATETATVQLVPPTVKIIPQEVTLRTGEKQKFQAIVRGDPNNTVRWSVAPSSATIEQGEFAAPESVLKDLTIAVMAICEADPTQTASATVRVVADRSSRWWVPVIFTYLAAIFALVAVLAGIWPPSGSDAKRVDALHGLVLKAEDTLRTASAAKQTAMQADSKARADLNAKPNDTTLKSQSDYADSELKRRSEDVSRAEASLDSSRHNANEAEEHFKALEDIPVPVFGRGSVSREVDLLWLVLITGALGSFVYSARSFVDFVGNRMFRASWSPWYLMYPLIGAALAFIFYLVIRGGFLTTGARSSDINVYGLVAISGLSGMFSKQATNKLDDLFTTMFRTDRDDKYLKDKLDPKSDPR